ncbi:hypothetical protein A4X13_0g6139 [Tilletia indica]|uniref:Ras-GAP domain-containing protein n=1 Tax=Tilletia indica TaxID=43049 RepID=A0A8T8SPL7_9BASI|nr:hypothetical protein A4X13_0g6139 [Tilletia indica]
MPGSFTTFEICAAEPPLRSSSMSTVSSTLSPHLEPSTPKMASAVMYSQGNGSTSPGGPGQNGGSYSHSPTTPTGEGSSGSSARDRNAMMQVSRRLTAASIGTNRNTNRYSVTALYSMAAEQDVEVEDDLARAQKRLRELKGRISAQSKKNFVLERDVRYLDSRIALLIANRMALDEQSEVASTLEEAETPLGTVLDDRKMQQYGNLFFLLQSEPRHIAALCRLVSLAEIDTLLQTVMFTLYGNQYESREEHLLLTMFQSVLSAQFETATDFGSLLRANTPVSRMMTTYTRRGPGQSYLKDVLAERINSLIEHKDLNLEVNPLKVYEQMINQIEEDTGALPPNLPRGVPAEVAAENPGPGHHRTTSDDAHGHRQLVPLDHHKLDRRSTLRNPMDLQTDSFPDEAEIPRRE